MLYVKMDFKIKVFIYCLVFMCINSCAQENQIMNINSLIAIEEDVNFYDALRQRSDLNFGRNIRILYTTIRNIQEFQKNYQDSDMHLDYVITYCNISKPRKKLLRIYGWFYIQFTPKY